MNYEQPAVEFHSQEMAQAREIKAKLARAIRSNSKERGALTPADTISALAPGTPLEMQCALLAEMATEDTYSDIRAVATPSGLIYFYSQVHVWPEEAAAKCKVEEVKFLVMEKVRSDSRCRVALTPADDLHALCPELEQERFAAILDEMQAEARYADLKSVTACNGEIYLYSDMHMTGKYAALLARAAASDPCTAIADTVREESRIYPRPTKVDLFKSQVFGIPSGSLEATITWVLKKEEFDDIQKLVHPLTGAVYLYSRQHMTERHASSVMDWLEVGMRNNSLSSSGSNQDSPRS